MPNPAIGRCTRVHQIANRSEPLGKNGHVQKASPKLTRCHRLNLLRYRPRNTSVARRRSQRTAMRAEWTESLPRNKKMVRLDGCCQSEPATNHNESRTASSKPRLVWILMTGSVEFEV
jgi:hypothetical protein